VLLRRADGRKDIVNFDTNYQLTYDMALEVLNEHRCEMELFQKKLAQKATALDEALQTISQAFPHINFASSQSCFEYIEKVDEEKEKKARELRQAALDSKENSRMGCDCCLVL